MTTSIKILVTIIITLCYQITFGQLRAYNDTTKIKNSSVETFTVPEVRAEYPGGFHKLSKYLNDNVTAKISVTKSEAEAFKVPVAQWFIDEKGKVTEAKILKSSNIPKIDQLFLTAIKNMPTWTPAQMYNKNVKDEFRIPLRICFK